MNNQSILQIVGRVHDLIVAYAAFYLAYGVALDFNRVFFVPGIHDKALLFVFVAGAINYLGSLNRGSWRYASIPDLVAIIKSSFLTVCIYTILLFMLSRAENLPRSVPPLVFVFSVFGMSGSRLIYRLMKEKGFGARRTKRLSGESARNVLLIDANDNADSFIRSIRRSETSDIRLIGILDARLEKKIRIQGLRILGKPNELENVVTKLTARGTSVSELIITDPNMSLNNVGLVLTRATELGLKVTRLPNLSESAELDAGKPTIKKLELSDLLGRNEFHADESETRRLIQNKTVLITGAGGSIGSELARQISKFGSKLTILADSNEYALYSIDLELSANRHENMVARIVDVRERDTVFRLFEEFRPEVVFHAAALKHVPLMEVNRIECLKTNILGTRNVADAAIEFGTDTFVLISTDKAVNPTNVMGASKRAAEVYCQAKDFAVSSTRFKTVRFGNVLGSNGSVVPRFQMQIDAGGPVTVTHPEITRFFMTIPEAVRLVLQASAVGIQRASDRGNILVLDMGTPVRIDDMARKMIELSGLRPDIDIKIEYTGLRPGEKLYEELFDDQEISQLPDERGYFAAAPRIVPAEIIDNAISDIESALIAADETRAIVSVRLIVPEYQPQK